MKLFFSSCFSRSKWMYHFLFIALVQCFHLTGISQQPLPDDVAQANMLSKTYKDDNIICLSSYHYFTFDKGKNSLDEKVVTIQEDAETEFISLKKYAALTYPEYYNKFIRLKTFKKAINQAANTLPPNGRGLTDR